MTILLYARRRNSDGWLGLKLHLRLQAGHSVRGTGDESVQGPAAADQWRRRAGTQRERNPGSVRHQSMALSTASRGQSWIRTSVRNLLHLPYRDLRLARPNHGHDLQNQLQSPLASRTRVQEGGCGLRTHHHC
ncbi:hypothetical protein VTN96DRAFT_1769 [Rasamsonia emersonii]